MSKEATGPSGTILGSSAYWAKINHGTLFAALTTKSPNYQTALTRLGHRASDAIDEVYGDLNQLADKIRYLPSGDRNTLAKQVQALYDVCKLSGVSAHRADDCIRGLSLSIMSPWNRGIRDERAIEKAVEAVKRSRFSGRDAAALLLEAERWGIDSAAGRDEKKRQFLQSIADLGSGSRFLRFVAEEYQQQTDSPRYRGRCGYDVGSRTYREHLEAQVFGRTLSGAFDTANYAALLRDDLNAIAQQLSRDLDDAQRNGDYITDDTADILRSVVNDLDRCGVSTMGLIGKIDKLAWYVGGDPNKIRKLQQALNKFGYDLEGDGVFGPKTLDALNAFHNEFTRGTIPSLAWIDPLQSDLTGIKFQEISSPSNGDVTRYASFLDVSSRSHNVRGGKNRGLTVFRADLGHGLPHHINTVNGEQLGSGLYQPSSHLQEEILTSLNHKLIDEPTYNILKNFDVYAKKVRVAGKVFAVAGAALDVLEIVHAMHVDTHDIDKKIGKTTYSSLAKIGGSWSLGSLGAKGGAMLGAAVGSVFPGPGTAIGGIVGGLLFGVIGSFSGSKLGEYVIDITMME